MPGPTRLLDLCERFRRDRRGNILVLFCLMAVELILFAGAAIDVALVVRFRSALQHAVDAAALAGANKFVGPTGALASEATARKVMADSILDLPSNGGVTFIVTPFATDPEGTTTAYNCRVSAMGRVRTTFLSIVIDYIQVSAAATAVNDVVNSDGDSGMTSSGSFSSTAGGESDATDVARVKFLEIEAIGPSPHIIRLTQ